MGSVSRIASLAQPLGRRFVDDAGEIWPLHGVELRARLNVTLSDASLTDYLLLNLGWIEVSTSPSRSSVRCRPRVITERGLASLLYLLCDAGAPRILLSVFGTDWQHSIHRTVQGVSTIIGGMRPNAPLAPAQDRRPLISREIDPKNSPLFTGFTGVIGQLSGSERLDDLTTPLNSAFSGRWCVCHVENKDVIIDHVGQGFTAFNPAWHQHATGLSLDRYADAAYGAWIASQRLEISATGKTVFDEVDAIVNFPRLGETRLRYTRATFPIALAGGAEFVVSAAASDSAINLRG
jgi:hypothetical protein